MVVRKDSVLVSALTEVLVAFSHCWLGALRVRIRGPLLSPSPQDLFQTDFGRHEIVPSDVHEFFIPVRISAWISLHFHFAIRVY